MASMIDENRFRGREAVSHEQGGGGGVDDIIKRLGSVESAVIEIRGDVREIKAVLPTLATKAEVAEVSAAVAQCATKAEVAEIRAAVAHCATKAELHALETRITKWLVGAVLAAAAIAFSAAKVIS